jgi:hypothetical protein
MKALDQARRLPPGLLSSTFMQMHQDSSLGFQGSPHRWLPLAKATILVRRVFSLRIMRMLRRSRSATYSSRSTWGHVAALQPSIFCPFEAAGRSIRYQIPVASRGCSNVSGVGRSSALLVNRRNRTHLEKGRGDGRARLRGLRAVFRVPLVVLPSEVRLVPVYTTRATPAHVTCGIGRGTWSAGASESSSTTRGRIRRAPSTVRSTHMNRLQMKSAECLRTPALCASSTQGHA